MNELLHPIAGLLDTITSTADATDCPGVCVHTLATLICYEVLEDVQCPSASMKCCVENSPSNTTLAPVEQTTTTARPTTTSKPRTTLAPKTTPKPTTKVEKTNNKEDSNAAEEGTCPGVCVADRIAEYCEAYLITSGLCKSGSKCCVSRDIYPDKVPADLRVPTTHTGPNATKLSNKPQVKVQFLYTLSFQIDLYYAKNYRTRMHQPSA